MTLPVACQSNSSSALLSRSQWKMNVCGSHTTIIAGFSDCSNVPGSSQYRGEGLWTDLRSVSTRRYRGSTRHGRSLLIVHEADQEHVASPHARDDSGEVGGRRISLSAPICRGRPARLQHHGHDVLLRSAPEPREFEEARNLPATTYDVMWEPISDQRRIRGAGDDTVVWQIWHEVGNRPIDDHCIVQHSGTRQAMGRCCRWLRRHVALVMSSNYFDEAEFNLSAVGDWDQGHADDTDRRAVMS